MIYVIITITGIVFATGCFVFNLIFRKRKLVTWSIKYISSFILALSHIFSILLSISLPSIFTLSRVIKLTSPVLNYIMVVGTIMLYLSVIAHVLPGESDIVNIIRCYVSCFHLLSLIIICIVFLFSLETLCLSWVTQLHSVLC